MSKRLINITESQYMVLEDIMNKESASRLNDFLNEEFDYSVWE